MIPDKIDYLRAILLCLAAQQNVIELTDADKLFIGEVLDHTL